MTDKKFLKLTRWFTEKLWQKERFEIHFRKNQFFVYVGNCFSLRIDMDMTRNQIKYVKAKTEEFLSENK